jgi:cytoskeletal protein CcmA (bactofilin family)
MKKGLIFLTLTLTISLLWLPFVSRAEAPATVQQTIIVPKTETINDNYVRFGNTIIIDGDVQGDVIVGGMSITINGAVAGDVLAAGQTITINGAVAGNVRVIGTTITINGTVGKNVNIAAQSATLSETAKVGWSVSFAAMSFTSDASISGNIYGYGSIVTLNNAINNNVTLQLGENGQATLDQKTVIGGRFQYTGNKSAIIQTGAQIKGQTVHQTWTQEISKTKKFLSTSWMYFRLIQLFGLLLVGTLVVSFFKKTTDSLSDKIRSRPGKTILWGLLYAIATPIVMVLLALTIIGIPLALIITVLYMIVIYISLVLAGTVLGRWLFSILQKNATAQPAKSSLLWAMIIGTCILFLITMTPWIGPLVSFISFLVTLGAIGELAKEKNNITKQ